jgi:hypothetical protein
MRRRRRLATGAPRLTLMESLISLARFPPVLRISSSDNFSLLKVGAAGGGVGIPRSSRVGIEDNVDGDEDDDDVGFGSWVEWNGEGVVREELDRTERVVVDIHDARSGTSLLRSSIVRQGLCWSL